MDFLKAKQIFDTLYKDVDGYSLSFKARKKMGYYDKGLTYGEIQFETFYQILQKIKPNHNEIFYDLGSGTGKAVLAAHLLFNFKKSVGIEILDELYQVSISIKKNYLEKIKPFLQKDNVSGEIEFIFGDILRVDFFNGDVFFVNSTCFPEYLMINLEKKFLNLKKGARIITLTNRLISEVFQLIDSEIFKQSWGEATVNFYIKK